MTSIKRILHALAHALRINSSSVESWMEDSSSGSKLMIGYRCTLCGRLDSIGEDWFGQGNPRC